MTKLRLIEASAYLVVCITNFVKLFGCTIQGQLTHLTRVRVHNCAVLCGSCTPIPKDHPSRICFAPHKCEFEQSKKS